MCVKQKAYKMYFEQVFHIQPIISQEFWVSLQIQEDADGAGNLEKEPPSASSQAAELSSETLLSHGRERHRQQKGTGAARPQLPAQQ